MSNADEPTLIGSFKSLGQTKIGDVFENKVVFIDHMEGLVMLDVTNEAEPVAAGSFFLNGYTRGVTVSGSFAYAVNLPSGLYVFDLTQPGPLEPVGVLHAPNAPRSMEVSEGSDASGPKLLCGAGRGNLQVYDVSDPTTPVKAATFATPGRAEHVALEGNLAYVADGEAGIQVVDLSTPSQPKLVGTYKTSGPARDVAVDSLVFVVVGDEEVLVLRQTP